MHPSRVLFLAEGQLGDLLLLTPALRALKTTYPNSHVAVMILERRSSSGPLIQAGHDTALGTNPHVDEVSVLNRDALRSLRGMARAHAELELVRLLRQNHYDAVICTFPEDRFILWAFASGARMRVGQQAQGFARWLTHALPIRKAERGVLEYYCDMVRALGASVESKETEYIISPRDQLWAKVFLLESGLVKSKVVAVHPGASGDYKIWPPERYAELIDALQQDPKIRVLLCRGPQDDDIVGAIRKYLKSNVTEVCPDGIGKLAALLRESALCISNDSGPRHLAVAVGTPSLAFFRQHHSREWKVYPESPACVTLESSEECPACPRGECLDRIPNGKRFGSHCLRFLPTETGVKKALDLLASL